MQAGRCRLAAWHLTSKPEGPLKMDHDHGSGEVRGLLCHDCNLALRVLVEKWITTPAALDDVLAYITPGALTYALENYRQEKSNG